MFDTIASPFQVLPASTEDTNSSMHYKNSRRGLEKAKQFRDYPSTTKPLPPLICGFYVSACFGREQSPYRWLISYRTPGTETKDPAGHPDQNQTFRSRRSYTPR
ncbi:hypothetical protein RRG08_001407 [Elysia crispata]|uniref:Uncharacterized protein n=1 Tax=Elysia crispata TaxID=231223 RepID=A0AAE0ZQV3_9GAST|nr:hypothetical protein RRG08_001407 [Elysia crispata]